IEHEIRNPMVWAGAYGNTGAALGILFTMPTKPSGPASIAIVAGAAVVGIALGLRLASAGAKAPVPTT
ncbi:MAG TPA: hypothetical protein VJ831_00335, partial [Jatrophihabitantaceae bacterium]|nr:hypothetical protein [Jatrophihabitantaceae bacterium]